jgi:tartrate-resistant acid phosphatase type 5
MTTFRISRRELLAAAPAAASLAFPARVWAQAAAPARAFIALGDWGRRGGHHQADVARQMGRAAGDAASLFTVTTGDNFYDSGVKDTADSHWKDSFDGVYTDPSLQRPWYPALGNHDYRGDPAAQIAYSATSARWRMPGRFYQLPTEAGRDPLLDLFVIDTQPMVDGCRDRVDPAIAANLSCQKADVQLAWLDEALGRSRAAWKLVIGHHPIYSGGEHGNTPELIAGLRPILERRGAAAYINGHDHDLQHIRRGGLHFVCSGGGSALRPTSSIEGTQFAQSLSGFALFRAERDRLRLEFVDRDGRTAYKADIPRPGLALAA